MDGTAPSAAKARLRETSRARLAALAPERAAAGSRAATRRLLALPEVAEARALLVCLSFGAELDTRELVDEWLARGRALYVPRAVAATRALEACAYPCPLETLSFGLRQPAEGVAALPADGLEEAIDVVVVLGLAFDLRGYRLGHGAGYFDRFLTRHPGLTPLGLAHDLQLVERLPAEAHDVPMRAVVTPTRVVRPAAIAGPAPP